MLVNAFSPLQLFTFSNLNMYPLFSLPESARLYKVGNMSANLGLWFKPISNEVQGTTQVELTKQEALDESVEENNEGDEGKDDDDVEFELTI